MNAQQKQQIKKQRRPHRDINQSTLAGGSAVIDENIDPLSNVANIADVMLVFACGLMLAIVTHWNVDLSITEMVPEGELTKVDQIEQMSEEMIKGEHYSERGIVYEDSQTGTLYLLEPTTEEEGTSGTSSGSQ